MLVFGMLSISVRPSQAVKVGQSNLEFYEKRAGGLFNRT